MRVIRESSNWRSENLEKRRIAGNCRNDKSTKRHNNFLCPSIREYHRETHTDHSNIPDPLVQLQSFRVLRYAPRPRITSYYISFYGAFTSHLENVHYRENVFEIIKYFEIAGFLQIVSYIKLSFKFFEFFI